MCHPIEGGVVGEAKARLNAFKICFMENGEAHIVDFRSFVKGCFPNSVVFDIMAAVRNERDLQSEGGGSQFISPLLELENAIADLLLAMMPGVTKENQANLSVVLVKNHQVYGILSVRRNYWCELAPNIETPITAFFRSLPGKALGKIELRSLYFK